MISNLTREVHMKRILPIFPALLLLLINACGEVPPEISPPMWTVVVQTQTAIMWTPTPTSTPDPNESNIVMFINEELSKADPLEQTMDAKYHVVDVSFPLTVNGSTVYRIDVRCECPLNTQCCIPERIFVVTTNAMKSSGDKEKIIKQMPGNVSEMKIACYDHTILVGVLAVRWSDVKDYLQEKINGYQLGARTYRSSLP